LEHKTATTDKNIIMHAPGVMPSSPWAWGNIVQHLIVDLIVERDYVDVNIERVDVDVNINARHYLWWAATNRN
jgi:hypothetical protein